MVWFSEVQARATRAKGPRPHYKHHQFGSMTVEKGRTHTFGKAYNRILGSVLTQVVAADGCSIVALANEADVLV
jgi:hypothetical protein